MPQTFNGIGTWYYGKKNLHQRDDTCEHCGNHAHLTSYDTTHFIVFLYIPVVPLGRFRVIDECGACSKHYAIPLKEWSDRKNDDLSQAAEALERDPWSTELALELVRTCAGYYDLESLAKYEAKIDQALSNDAAGMAFLAAAYEYFHEPTRAEGAYRKSLMLQDDPEVRRQLGVLLIREARPAEAHEYLSHLLDPSHDDDRATLYFLVEAYQANGMHRDAGELLDAMTGAFSGLESDPLFQKYRKRVHKRVGTTKPLPSPLMQGKPLGYDNSRTVLVVALAGIAITALAGIFLYHEARTIDAHLVNGLDRAYNVDIAGETHYLAPLAATEISFPRRAELVATVPPEEIGWPATVNLAMPTNLWSTLFDDRTYVINPDRAAIIIWEQTEYRVNPIETENPTRVHLGKGLHAFDDIDYVFEDFPEEITLGSGQTAERRNRIWQIFDVAPSDAYAAAVDAGRRADGISYLTALLRANPDDTALLGFAGTVIPAQEFTELARPHLEARPLKMEWHRIYQTILERAGRADDLLDEYRERFEAEPNNPDLLYLYARATPDSALAEQRMRAAAENDPPSAYGVHALAYRRLTQARFEEALALATRARELDPDNALFSYAESEALLALRRFDPMIEQTEAVLEENPYDGNHVAYAVQLYVAAGRDARAREVIDGYVQTLAESDGDAEIWRSYLESLHHLGAGDWNGFIERSATIEVPRTQYQAALGRGDVPSALESLKAAEPSAYDHLVVYVTASRARARDVADAELETAIAELRAGTTVERHLARCLAGESPPDAALDLELPPDAKVVGLAALLAQSDDRRLRALARKLNYGLTFERHYLDRTAF